jgi:hypothetical protein
VVLQLDSRIALEATILNRLERIPQPRRQEWLRGLLLQGFRVECQALRGAPSNARTDFVIRTSRFNTGIKSSSVSKPDPNPPVIEMAPSRLAATEKPFAALGKVIG